MHGLRFVSLALVDEDAGVGGGIFESVGDVEAMGITGGVGSAAEIGVTDTPLVPGMAGDAKLLRGNEDGEPFGDEAEEGSLARGERRVAGIR